MKFKLMFSFGPVTFPARYETAVDKPLEMVNLCVGSNGHQAHDPRPLKAPKQCEECGVITDYTALKKGVKQSGGYAVVDATDVSKAAEAYSEQFKGSITVVPHPAVDVFTMTAPGGSTYYVTPDGPPIAQNHYQTIAKLIRDVPELAFVGLHTPRSATGMYLITERNGVLVMEKRVRAEDLKAAPQVGGSVDQALYEGLKQLLFVTATPFDPATYEDGYVRMVRQLSEAAESVVKVSKGKSETKAPTAPAAGNSEALLAQIQAMIAQEGAA